MVICGLANLGNTCFLNTAIQSLLSLSTFTMILNSLKDQHSNFICFFQNALGLTTTAVLKPEAVYELYIRLSKKKIHMPEDAVECLLHLIEYFENNVVINNNNINNNNTICMCVNYWKTITNDLIVHKLFSGIIHKKTECSCCGFIKQHFELFKIIPIYNTCSIKQTLINLVSLRENICNVRCDNCEKQVTFESTQYIHRLPLILMFETIGQSENYVYETLIKIDHSHGINELKYEYKLKNIILYENAHYRCISFDSIKKDYFLIDDETIRPPYTSSSVRLLVYECESAMDILSTIDNNNIF